MPWRISFSKETIDLMGPLLQKINSPADVKKLPIEKLPELAQEIREYILEVVSGFAKKNKLKAEDKVEFLYQ